MKGITQQVRIGMGVTAVGLAGFLMTAQSVFALGAYPIKASEYRTWLVRAMDQCNPATVSVVQPGDPTSGCLQANVVTDAGFPADSMGATMKLGRLIVARSNAHAGRVSLFGTGFQAGQRVKVRLTLRDTQLAAKKHPAQQKSVTFEDVTIDCGNNALTGCFVANANGAIAGTTKLTSCLTQNGQPTGLAKGNVEILDAAVVNCDGPGKVVAVPGILN